MAGSTATADATKNSSPTAAGSSDVVSTDAVSTDAATEEVLAAAAPEGVTSVPLSSILSGRAAAWTAAILLAVAVLGGVSGAALTQRQASSARTATDLTQVALDAATSPSARTVEFKGGDQILAKLVLLPDGNGYLVPRALQPLGPDRTYQLWGVQGTKTVSLAVLGPRPGVAAFHVPTPSIGGLMLSNESQPGSAQPSNQVSAAQL